MWVMGFEGRLDLTCCDGDTSRDQSFFISVENPGYVVQSDGAAGDGQRVSRTLCPTCRELWACFVEG